MLNIERIQVFMAVVEHRGFSRASRSLRMSTAAVSKHITLLEEHVGLRLLERTTRRVSVTDFGELYYQQCRRLMLEVQETENVAAALKQQPTGLLRAFVTRYFAETFVLPHLSAFSSAYPAIKLELELAERIPEPAHEKLDLIFGASHEGPPDWIQRKIAVSRYVLCASPDYFERAGMPTKPSDLVHHCHITHSRRRPENRMTFSNGDVIHVNSAIALNDTSAMLACALQGLGIAKLHHYLVDEHLVAGRLRLALDPLLQTALPIYVFYPERRYLAPKVRVFIDFFASIVARHSIRI